MPDPREINRARDLIQDIQIFHTREGRLVCDVLLYRGGELKNTVQSGIEAQGFASRMAELNQNKTNPDFEASANHRFQEWRWMSDTLPGPDANVEFTSKKTDLTREAAAAQAAQLLQTLANRTGLDAEELLGRVGGRNVSNPLTHSPEPITRDELAPLMHERTVGAALGG